MSSLTTIGNGHSSRLHSGLIPKYGSSYLPREMPSRLKYVLSSYSYWLFTSMFPPNQEGHDEATSGRDPARDASGEHYILSNSQSIGVKVVGIWNIPTVIGLIVCLIQVVTEDQKAKPNQELLLHLCFGASLATIFLGLVLFIFSVMLRNDPRRVLMIKFLVMVAFGSTFVDICLLITCGFTVM